MKAAPVEYAGLGLRALSSAVRILAVILIVVAGLMFCLGVAAYPVHASRNTRTPIAKGVKFPNTAAPEQGTPRATELEEPLKTQLTLYEKHVDDVEKALSVLITVAGLLTASAGLAAAFTVSHFERRADSILKREQQALLESRRSSEKLRKSVLRQLRRTKRQLPRFAFLEAALSSLLNDGLWRPRGKRALYPDSLSEAELVQVEGMEIQVNALAPLIERSAERSEKERLSYVYQMLGNFYGRRCWGNPADRALKDKPDQPLMMAKSLHYFARAVTLNRSNHTAYNDWGYVINWTEQWDEVKHLHQRSLDIFPQQQRAILNIVDVLIKERKFVEASDFLKRLPSAAGSRDWVNEQIGEFYHPERAHLYWAFWASRQVRDQRQGKLFLRQCVERLERAIPQTRTKSATFGPYTSG